MEAETQWKPSIPPFECSLIATSCKPQAPPATQSLAEKMQVPVEDIRAAMERLAAGKAIVLQPESREILMANPLLRGAHAFPGTQSRPELLRVVRLGWSGRHRDAPGGRAARDIVRVLRRADDD